MTSQTVESNLCRSRLTAPDFTQQIERLARKYTRSNTIAWEDAAQSAQIKILQAVEAGKFRQGEVPAFDAWALTVARFEIIDLVRREKVRYCLSLDALILGKTLALSETIAAEFDALDSLERTDLVHRAVEAIQILDQQYPERQYWQLWQGQEKKQTQLAMELGLSQGEVSKRWKELVRNVAERLGVPRSETVQRGHHGMRYRRVVRQRSGARW
jgi:RNA polymerase sigma factor (sigma-70 family)